MRDQVDAGASLKKTPVTEEFDLERFRAHYGDRALPMFVPKDSGELTVLTSSSQVEPRAGRNLIGLVGR